MASQKGIVLLTLTVAGEPTAGEGVTVVTGAGIGTRRIGTDVIAKMDTIITLVHLCKRRM